MVYMAKDIKENRVVEDKPRNKWAGIPMTEEQKKEYAEVWKKVDSCLINYTTIKIKKNLMKSKKPTTENTKKNAKEYYQKNKEKIRLYNYNYYRKKCGLKPVEKLPKK